jgi:hypothetical protein
MCASHLILKNEDYKIILVENYPCNSKKELEIREGFYIRNNDCINKNVNGRTPKEWREENHDELMIKKKAYREEHKDEINIKQTKFREDNREKLRKSYLKHYYENKEALQAYRSEKIVCECGCEISRNKLPRHKRSQKHIKLMENK